MPAIDPITLRVARRHQAGVLSPDAPPTKTRIEYACSGRIGERSSVRTLAALRGHDQ
jgi:hypothetical protein